MSEKPILAQLLTFNGGFVDTAGFLALQGLFTAHVTGNFVTLGATLLQGNAGAAAKVLALPIFCIIVVLTRLADHWLRKRKIPALQYLLALEVLLLAVGSAFAIGLDAQLAIGNGWPALLTGLTLVTAMAVQNGLHRVHLTSLPPSTLMTGTTTQIMLDLADLMRGVSAESSTAAHSRLRQMVPQVAIFAFGCGAAAILFAAVGSWSFLAPPLIVLLALLGGCLNTTRRDPRDTVAAAGN